MSESRQSMVAPATAPPSQRSSGSGDNIKGFNTDILKRAMVRIPPSPYFLDSYSIASNCRILTMRRMTLKKQTRRTTTRTTGGTTSPVLRCRQFLSQYQRLRPPRGPYCLPEKDFPREQSSRSRYESFTHAFVNPSDHLHGYFELGVEAS